ARRLREGADPRRRARRDRGGVPRRQRHLGGDGRARPRRRAARRRPPPPRAGGRRPDLPTPRDAAAPRRAGPRRGGHQRGADAGPPGRGGVLVVDRAPGPAGGDDRGRRARSLITPSVASRPHSTSTRKFLTYAPGRADNFPEIGDDVRHLPASVGGTPWL